MTKYNWVMWLLLAFVLQACSQQKSNSGNETTAQIAKPAGMSRQQFDEIINSDQLVLVDFYADWCAPCKKMAPYLDTLTTEMAGKVTVVRINTDDNQELASQLSISGLPTLLVFKNKTLLWKNEGYIGKEEVVKHLN